MGAGHGGRRPAAAPAGTAAELAVGFGMAQQMMQQGFAGGGARRIGRTVGGGARAAGPRRRGEGARRQRGRRAGGARVGRAEGQEDRLVVAHLARRAQQPTWRSSVWRPRFRALEKHACPACGAQAEWNPAKQKLVCPFCGTESPYQIDRDTGKVVENDLAAALRDLPDDERGWQADAPQRAVPELPRGDGLRSRTASGRTASSADRRRWSPTRRSSRRSARGRAAVPDRSQPRARRHPPLVAQQVVRARPAGEGGARRHGPQPLHSVLDLRRARALPVGRRGRPLLLRQRRGPRQQGQPRGAAGAARALGSRLRRRRAHLRR